MKRHGVVLLASALAIMSMPTSASAHAPGPVASVNTPDPLSTLEALAAFFNTPSAEAIPIAAKDSPAHLYLHGIWRMAANDPLRLFATTLMTVSGDTLVDGTGLVVSELELDESGLIVDFNRRGRPLSETVFPLHEVVEADGVRGIVHSARYFDGNLQFVVLTENNSDVDAYLTVEEFTAGRSRTSNRLVNPVPPGVTQAYLDVFEGASEDGGTARGQLWANDEPVAEFEITVPPAG